MSRSSFLRHARVLLAPVGMACVLAAAGAAQAKRSSTSANFVGWAYYQESSDCVTADSRTSYNSQGGAVTLCRLSEGSYKVEFGNLSPGFHPSDVQVLGVNQAVRCVAQGWTNIGADVVANVECFDPLDGKPKDSNFMLLYQARTAPFGTAGKGIAFLWADQPAAPSYVPSIFFQYNSAGGTNTIMRNGTGNYTATIPGLKPIHSDVQLTAYGAAAYCNVVHWLAHNGGGTDINVQCYDAFGNVADEYFDLAYAVKTSFGFTKGARTNGVWAWANDATSTSVYTPTPLYQWNGFHTGNLTAQKFASGSYFLAIPGSLLAVNSAIPFVTAYGPTARYCSVGEWRFYSTETDVFVGCTDPRGNPADSQFDFTLQTAK